MQNYSSGWKYLHAVAYTSLSMFGTKLHAQLALINIVWPKFCSEKLGADVFGAYTCR